MHVLRSLRPAGRGARFASGFGERSPAIREAMRADVKRLEGRPYELHACVEDSIDLVAQRAAQKGVELTLLIAPEVPARVVGDLGRLRQVLVSLLDNAVRFTDAGEVVLACWVAAGDRDRIRFAVRDTGVGITTISKRIVELMGGDMCVASELGGGSTFHFTIGAHTDASPAALSEPRPLAGRRVLIADGHATRRYGLVLQAATLGLDGSTTDGAPPAAARLRAGERFDALVVATGEPSGGAPDAIVDLLRVAGEQGTPVLLVGAPGGGLEGRPGPLVEAVPRPVRLAQLASALGRLLDGAARTPVRTRQTPDSLDASLGSRFPLRVLLAEDNRINQKVALRLLERMGYRADVAVDGLEVLAAMDRQPYDVILMDIQMPGMDGIEAARTIRQSRPAHEQPAIVALTANVTGQNRAECIDAGMDGFLAKPVVPAALAKALEHCGRARSADAASDAQRVSI